MQRTSRSYRDSDSFALSQLGQSAAVRSEIQRQNEGLRPRCPPVSTAALICNAKSPHMNFTNSDCAAQLLGLVALREERRKGHQIEADDAQRHFRVPA